MNIPIWIWYIVGGAILFFIALCCVGIVLSAISFRRTNRDFNEQRDRVQANLRRAARRT